MRINKSFKKKKKKKLWKPADLETTLKFPLYIGLVV